MHLYRVVLNYFRTGTTSPLPYVPYYDILLGRSVRSTFLSSLLLLSGYSLLSFILPILTAPLVFSFPLHHPIFSLFYVICCICSPRHSTHCYVCADAAQHTGMGSSTVVCNSLPKVKKISDFNATLVHLCMSRWCQTF
jgi:hypothetical protein